VSHKTLNLGILAHVDAGKTTLTERLLYAAGVIDQLGSVDAGTTQTDSLDLERQRGITIKSAVASFLVGDVAINLIDTPGHPDFIAEVERVLGVLDGAVLVISAVEGVQPQTRILLSSLQRLRIPALLFVNKIDRRGADAGRVLQAISQRLKISAVPMGGTRGLGTRDAEFMASDASDSGFRARLTEVLAERNEEMLAAYVAGEAGVPYDELRAELAAQTMRSLVYPVFFGSAITGAGIGPLMAGLAEWLPTAPGDTDGPVSGTIFKIERSGAGEKIAYVRMFSGTVRVRDRVRFGAGLEGKVTSIAVFARGPAAQRSLISAGEIGKLWGLTEIQIGDRIGHLEDALIASESMSTSTLGIPPGSGLRQQFPPPTLESVVVPRDEAGRARLRVALGQIAEQDPFITIRQDDERREITVSLYGEVQKEVIQATLANDFDVEVTFRETTMICIERPVRGGSAVEFLQADTHPYSATIGLRVEPGPVGSGLEFRLDVDPRLLPIYIYKTAASFRAAMTQYVRLTLEEGLFGWRVTDCVVTMNECGYYIGDGPRKRVLPTPRTTAADFRKLTPAVLMRALRRAGTVVCEPVAHVRVEIPAERTGNVLSVLTRLGAAVEAPMQQGDLSVVQTLLASARVHDVQRQLPGLTGGEGVIEASFAGYQPVRRGHDVSLVRRLPPKTAR
jgi:ribosomal protection tetracycline resistance protein